MKPCLPPVRLPSAMRHLHAMHYSADNWRCCPTCLFWTTNSRQKHPTILDKRLSVGYALRRLLHCSSKDEPCTTYQDYYHWGRVIVRTGGRDVQVQHGDARHSLRIESLIVREIGSDSTVLRTALAFVARLPAGDLVLHLDASRPRTECPMPQMASASRLSPKLYLALQYLIRNFFRIGDVVSV
eukprot:1747632-Pyramimonas_sp.AAC.2